MVGSSVRFYFDFISPYSYIASQLIERRPELSEIDFDYRPVVLGTILSRLGQKGPGEIVTRRRHGLVDGLLLASAYDLPFEGPPTHPFNSIYALRSVLAVEPGPLRRALATLYFRKVWGEGASLEDLDVLRGCLSELGIDQDPEDAGTRRELRQALKANTAELLALGGWGVPSFVSGEVLLFGHDRLDLLLAYLRGEASYEPEQLERLLARPQPGRIV